MKIKKMTAHFGALDGRTLELGGGMNILYAPNESGKSTWCAFIRAMLYGIDTAQRAKNGRRPDKTKYRPWSGAPMSGSMELETTDGPVTLRRLTERDDRPMQAFSAVRTGTELPAPGLTASDAGQTLTGMPRAVFERTVFIGQAAMETSNDPELERRIEAMVSSGEEGVSFTETEKNLKTWLRRRSGRSGAIPALEDEAERVRRSLEDIRARERSAADAEQELTSLETRRDDVLRRMEQARAVQRKKALEELGAARHAVAEAETARRERDGALAEAEEAVAALPFDSVEPETARERAGADTARAAELLAAAERTPSVRRAYVSLIAAALAGALSFVLPQRAVCIGVCAALLLLFVWLYTSLRKRNEAKARMLAERAEILSRYGIADPEEMPPLLEEYESLWRAMERAEDALDTAEDAVQAARRAQERTEKKTVNDLDFINGDNEAARLGREAERLRTRAAELRERRALAEGQARAIGDPMALQSELEALTRRREALEEQERALSLALETLQDADGELQQRLAPEIAKRAAEYFSVLTDGRYDELSFARDLTGAARPAGDAVGRELDYLSAGARDQLYLALRLALCDLVLPQETPCPIVLDDALTDFDDARMERALRLLRGVADTRQVLLFTCHTREGAFFADDPAVKIQTI